MNTAAQHNMHTSIWDDILDIDEDQPEDVAPQALTTLQRGDTIAGDYSISSVIGQGAVATVYEAKHLRSGRTVAIKLLDANLQAEHGLNLTQRFEREARAAASIDHESVVSIIDYGLHGETHLPFIVMEKLDGHDLYTELQHHGALEPTRALKLIKGALDALGRAHTQGIVHKDLKPENLFIANRNGEEHLVILDFGIARLEQASDLTQMGEITGTPLYLAPEYITSRVATPSVDVYQMALILMEMLTGKPVVDAPNLLMVMDIHLEGALHLNPAIMQSPLGAVLECALARDPNARFDNARAFKNALETVPPQSVADALNPPQEAGVLNMLMHADTEEFTIPENLLKPAKRTRIEPTGQVMISIMPVYPDSKPDLGLNAVAPTRKWLPRVGGIALAALLVLLVAL